MNSIDKRQAEAVRTICFSIVGNIFLALLKGIAGIFGNSYALIADAIESTTDVFSSLMVLLGLRYIARPADHRYPYGHGRLEPLFTFVVVGFLILAAATIAYESVQHIQTPHKTPAPFTLLVLLIVIAIKELSYRHVKKKSTELNSTVLSADAWHHRSDALTSLAAFIGISVALFMGEGYETADDWAALVASAIIVFNAYMIFRPALGELLDEQLHDKLVDQVREVATRVDGVDGTEKCFIRKGGMTYQVDLHLIVNGDISVREGHEISHKLKSQIQLELPEVANVLIHVEPHEH